MLLAINPSHNGKSVSRGPRLGAGGRFAYLLAMQATDRPPLVLDMVSDPVCPWCYVGLASLDWALMALGFQYDITLRFRPYRLAPDTPPGGMDRAEALAAKFPDPGARAQARAAIIEAGRMAGVTFDPDTPERLPDTTDAHRVLRWSHEADLQRETKRAVMDAYWQRGEDIGERAVLARLAGRVGLDEGDINARLASDEDRADVAEEAAAFRAGGVDGVPTFIVNEQTGFAGALPKDQLTEAIRQLAEAGRAPDGGPS